MKKYSSLIIVFAVFAMIVGSLFIKGYADEKKQDQAAMITVDDSLMKIVQKLDPTVGKPEIEEDDMSAYKGLVRFVGEKYKIHVDTEKNTIRSVHWISEKEEVPVNWDEETAVLKAKEYLDIFANGNVKYDLKEKISQSYGMWEYTATEYKNGEITGTVYTIIFTLGGEICAARLALGKNIDAQRLTSEKALEIAKENLLRYRDIEDINVIETVQSSIAGRIVWKVKSDKYIVTIDAISGECLLIMDMK